MSAWPQEIEIFRELLVLPLRLSRAENAGQPMLDFTTKLESESQWRLLEPFEAATAPTRSSLRDKVTQSSATDAGSEDNAEDYKTSRKADANEEYFRNWAYAERVYFHPFVQKFLYGTKQQIDSGSDELSLKSYCQRPESAWEKLRIIAAYGNDIPGKNSQHTHFAIDLSVDRCELSVITNPGLVLLTLEVSATAETGVRRLNRTLSGNAKKKDTKKKNAAPEDSKLTIAEAMAIHNSLRRLFPPFFVKKDANLIYEDSPNEIYADHFLPLKVIPNPKDNVKTLTELPPHEDFGEKRRALIDNGQEPLASWWENLLAEVINHKGKHFPDEPMFCQVVDERIPSMAFVASQHVKSINRATRIRFCFADSPSDQNFYSEEFLEDFESKHAYLRFINMDTYYAASSYSFTCITGHDKPNTQSNGPQFIFSRDELQEHFRRMYHRMFFIVQMQKAALLMFSNWMSVAVGSKADSSRSKYRKTISDIRQRFVQFTHRGFFSNVSNQEQPRELFELMQKHAQVNELFDEVNEESNAAWRELEVAADEKQAQNGFMLNLLGIIVAFIGAPLGFWSNLKEIGAFGDQSASRLYLFLFFSCLSSIAVTWLLESNRRKITNDDGPTLFGYRIAVWMTVLLMLIMSYAGYSFWTPGNLPPQ